MKPVLLPPSLRVDDPDYTRARYAVNEAAAYLCMSRSRLYEEIAGGLISCRRDGNRRYRFSQADLDAWSQAHRREATAMAAPRLRVPVVRSPHAGGLPARKVVRCFE